ncbi:MAG: hypothetical protein LAP21_00890 [Acidobacteriia bacterium]|nr:hypothetical protein [Terriglobia bacterium]
MKKVVVERPRWGSRARNRKFGARLKYVSNHDYEDQPKKALGFESYAGFSKELTDVLNPLRRFLRSRLGRPWDKVYSELCAGLDRRKVTGLHIFQHLESMVARSCHFGTDGALYSILYGERQVRGFYVHPRTGLLCEAQDESRQKRKLRQLEAEEITRLHPGGNIGYQKHEGIWYRVALQRIWVNSWDPTTRPLVRDLFLKTDVRLGWGENWVAVEKKQCNRRELAEVRALLEIRKRKIRKM